MERWLIFSWIVNEKCVYEAISSVMIAPPYFILYKEKRCSYY